MNNHVHPLFQSILDTVAPRPIVSLFYIFGGFGSGDDWLGTYTSREALTRALQRLPEAECVIQRDCDGVVTDISQDVLS